MSNIEQVFKFNKKPVRTIVQSDGEPWFVANDVCKILGIKNVKDVLGRLPEDEKSGVGITDPHGRIQTTNIINEPGIYRLIFSSRKEEAENFKRWVFHDVLPSIRKTGSYTLPQNATVFQALTAALGEEQAQALGELNKISKQVYIGFGFHDDNYITLEECSDLAGGLPVGWFFWELQDKGYIELEYAPKGQYKNSIPRYIHRLTELGRTVGEETNNIRRTGKNTDPFSFRFKKEFMFKIINKICPDFEAGDV